MPFATKAAPKTETRVKRTRNEGTRNEIAEYYGFELVATPIITKEILSEAKSLSGSIKARSDDYALSVCPEEKVAVLRQFPEETLKNVPLPLLVYYTGAIERTDNRGKKPKNEEHMGLEIIGTTKSIAEAILIKTTIEILREAGHKELHVCINSIGDKESIGKFTKELTAYYRKHLDMLPSHCKQTFKKDVFELLDCRNDKCELIKEDAPKSISFLSEPSRQHFKEVLEYLEILGVPYKIHNHLVGDKSFCCQTLFEVKSGLDGDKHAPALAVGVRYDTLAKRMGHKRELPSIGVRLAFKQLQKSKVDKKAKPKAPQVFFIQLGFEAKLRSLVVIEMLRQAKIPIYQSLSRDKLVSQLSLAESMQIPFTILMGQKEALEGTVIVRSQATRSQETVPISVLPDYLKKLKL